MHPPRRTEPSEPSVLGLQNNGLSQLTRARILGVQLAPTDCEMPIQPAEGFA
jgi:hypothetical protein